MKEPVNINITLEGDLHARVKAKSALIGIALKDFVIRVLEDETKGIKLESEK
jgi:hypothetical protein